jgi:uncharacterized protein YqeY
MSLFDKISNDLKNAMLAKQKDRLEPLRAIKTAFLLAKAETGAETLQPEQEIKILQKLIKQRKDSAEIYKTQNRIDLYQKEIDEAAIIEEYLPKQLSPIEIETVVRQIIQQVGAKSPQDIGKVMSIASKELSGKAENKTIVEIAKKLLTAG